MRSDAATSRRTQEPPPPKSDVVIFLVFMLAVDTEVPAAGSLSTLSERAHSRAVPRRRAHLDEASLPGHTRVHRRHSPGRCT